MLTSFPELLFWLLVGHAIADYPLQGEFLARLKNRNDSLNQPPYPLGSPHLWFWGLFNHGMIHAGFVAFCTGYIWLGVAEFFAHVIIDRMKTEKQIGFHTDQLLHIACKAIWAFIAIALSAQ